MKHSQQCCETAKEDSGASHRYRHCPTAIWQYTYRHFICISCSINESNVPVLRSSCSCSPIPPSLDKWGGTGRTTFHSSKLYTYLIITKILRLRHGLGVTQYHPLSAPWDLLGGREAYIVLSQAECCICLKTPPKSLSARELRDINWFIAPNTEYYFQCYIKPHFGIL